MTTTSYDEQASNRELLRRSVGFLNVALRHRRLVIVVPVLAAALSIALTLRQGRSFTSGARFLTQGSRPATASSGLAAQLGINVGSMTSDPTQIPDFYSDLIVSRPILERTARAQYRIAKPGEPPRNETLAQYYGSEDRAVDVLGGSISSSVAVKTGIVSFTVKAPTPTLAQSIAQQLLHEIDDFNRERRQSRSMAERKFTESRLVAADQELKAAENTLQDFYTHNRGYERSPELKFQEDRLTREAARRQQLYASLAQAYEQAKIEEVRDTPVITVLEDPRVPTVGNARGTVMRALVAFAVALVATLIWSVLVEMFRGANLNASDEFTELHILLGRLRRDFRHPIRGLLRRND